MLMIKASNLCEMENKMEKTRDEIKTWHFNFKACTRFLVFVLLAFEHNNTKFYIEILRLRSETN